VLRGHPCGKPGDMHGDTSPPGQRMIIGGLFSRMSTPAAKYANKARPTGGLILCVYRIFLRVFTCSALGFWRLRSHAMTIKSQGGVEAGRDTDRISDVPKPILCGTRTILTSMLNPQSLSRSTSTPPEDGFASWHQGFAGRSATDAVWIGVSAGLGQACLSTFSICSGGIFRSCALGGRSTQRHS